MPAVSRLAICNVIAHRCDVTRIATMKHTIATGNVARLAQKSSGSRIRPNENKISDGYRRQAGLAMEVFS
jgi:hypothetical protein